MIWFERNPRKKGLTVNLIPLINVIFLILIFFMVAGTVDQKDTLKITPPKAQSGQESKVAKQLTIFVDADGQLAINEQFVEKNNLAATLSVHLRDEPKQSVTIKSDSELPATTLLWLLNILEQNGAKKVTLTTLGTE